MITYVLWLFLISLNFLFHMNIHKPKASSLLLDHMMNSLLCYYLYLFLFFQNPMFLQMHRKLLPGHLLLHTYLLLVVKNYIDFYSLFLMPSQSPFFFLYYIIFRKLYNRLIIIF